jgi:hypothetical protein
LEVSTSKVNKNLSQKQNTVVEHLLLKYDTLSSSPSTTQINKQNKRKGKEKQNTTKGWGHGLRGREHA